MEDQFGFGSDGWADRWAWFGGSGRFNRDDEYNGIYPSREIAMEHRPERAVRFKLPLHREHRIKEWTPDPQA